GLARVVGPIAGGVLFEHVGVPAPYLAGAALMLAAALFFHRSVRRNGAPVRRSFSQNGRKPADGGELTVG
nr:hypothetical protein [Actinomycetota bacterium]